LALEEITGMGALEFVIITMVVVGILIFWDYLRKS
jgi:hypothetical protein